MKVLIDGMNLSLSEGTGVATYARNLTAALRAMGHEVHILYGENIPFAKDPLAREAVFFDPNSSVKERRLAFRVLKSFLRPGQRKPYPIPDTHVVKQPISDRLPSYDRLWNSRSLFTFANSWFQLTGRMVALDNPMGVDVAHWTYPMPIRLKNAKNYYTIHDLVPLKLPYTTLDNKIQYAKVIRAIAESADKVVTVSETSRRDIVEMFGMAEDMVVNTYQSVTLPEKMLARPEADVFAAVRQKFGLKPRGYLLFYGAVEPKKNVRRLVEAYLASGVNMPLVVAGKSGWLAEEAIFYELGGQEVPSDKTKRIVAQTSSDRFVMRLQHLRLADLVDLVRGARAVVFPSIYEGFGLPIVEAMLCGTPVMTSDFGAMAEIADRFATLTDPYDTGSIGAGLVAMSNSRLIGNDLLPAAQQHAAASFGVDAYIDRLRGIY